jgi:hypothetical protein
MFHKEGYKIITITMVVMALGIIAAGEMISNLIPAENHTSYSFDPDAFGPAIF